MLAWRVLQRRGAGKAASVDGDVEVALLNLASRNNLFSLGIHVLAALSTGLMGYAEDPRFYLRWLGLVMALSVGRLVLHCWFLAMLAGAREPDPTRLRRWRLTHCAALLASSLLWAALALLKLPVENDEMRMTILVILSALAGGAIGVLAPLRVTGAIYVIVLLAPASLLLLFGHVFAPALGALGLAFMVVALTGHQHNHHILVRSIRLAADNERLAEALRRQNEDIDLANRSLEARVAERTAELKDMAARAQVASRAKSAFLATVSHELRTPLNGVLGMAQAMDDASLDPVRRQQLEVIRSSAHMLLRIINDVLDISKLEAGKLEIVVAPFDVLQFADGLNRLFAGVAEAKGLRFAMVVDDSAPGFREGDEVRLRQIVGNLISNAIKFTTQGEIGLRLAGDAEQLEFEVSDTGIGIAPAAQAQVFDRFVQAEGDRAQGAGLGLAIARELAELMGGSITLTSDPGRGSRFTVRVNAPRIEAPAAASEDATPEAAAGGEDLKILVVDDNATNRLVLQTLLTHLGLASQTANDGIEALAAFESGPWDLILMDINMPRMDGLEATRNIRAIEARQLRPRTPIVAVTASVLSHETERYYAADMDEVVAKPVDIQRLAECLNRRLGGEANAA